MIKTKIIETNKAKILLVDGLPEDAQVSTNPKELIWYPWGNIYAIKKENIPPGNWQPLNFLNKVTEEQAKRILPEKEVSTNYEFKSIEGYRGYDENSRVLYTDSRCALISLIEANVPLRNKYNELPLAVDYNKWKAEEEKVFHNPFLLVEIK